MKAIAALLLCTITLASRAQELHVGDALPAITIKNIINSAAVQANALKGKVVILDFWATWCSPCVSALGKFEGLKKQFGSKLVVLAVSDESRSRLKQFMVNRPTTLLIGSDTANSLQPLFPHRSIPHTVLIGTDGSIQAITDAENITPQVITQCLQNMTIKLPLKKDNITFNIDDYFKADTMQSQAFNMLPPVEGAGSMSRRYPEGFFKNRRLTIVNMPMDGLYRMAYDKTYYLVVNEYDTVKHSYADEQKYCVDMWVAEPGKPALLQYFRQQLGKQFVDVEAVLEKRMMKVLVLKADSSAVHKLKPSNQSNDLYNAGGSHFEGNGVTLASLADYMESFGLYNGKVIDETGITGRYDIFFEWQPEKKETLKTAFANLGLHWEAANREVEVLVLKKRES